MQLPSTTSLLNSTSKNSQGGNADQRKKAVPGLAFSRLLPKEDSRNEVELIENYKD